MLDLASRYWDWRAIKINAKKEADEIKRKEAETFAKYGLYITKAKKHKDTPLYYECEEMTSQFETCINSGVIEAKRGTHYCKAKFGNGTSVEFWTANRMYAYARGAEFTNADGKKNKFSEGSMPKFWMCFMLEDKVENFNKTD